MSEKITPVSKPVPRKGGVKQGSENTTLTTPNHEGNKYWSNGKDETKSIMGKK